MFGPYDGLKAQYLAALSDKIALDEKAQKSELFQGPRSQELSGKLSFDQRGPSSERNYQNSYNFPSLEEYQSIMPPNLQFLERLPSGGASPLQRTLLNAPSTVPFAHSASISAIPPMNSSYDQFESWITEFSASCPPAILHSLISRGVWPPAVPPSLSSAKNIQDPSVSVHSHWASQTPPQANTIPATRPAFPWMQTWPGGVPNLPTSFVDQSWQLRFQQAMAPLPSSAACFPFRNQFMPGLPAMPVPPWALHGVMPIPGVKRPRGRPRGSKDTRPRRKKGPNAQSSTAQDGAEASAARPVADASLMGGGAVDEDDSGSECSSPASGGEDQATPLETNGPSRHLT